MEPLDVPIRDHARGGSDRRGRRVLVAVAVFVALWIAGISVAYVRGVGSPRAMPGMDMGTAPMEGMDDAGPARGQADVTFALAMLAHTRQSIEVAGLAVDRSGLPEVKSLALEIADARDELSPLTQWLKAWGVNPDVPSEHTAGMGMLDAQTVSALAEADGGDFDRRFLEAMIEHHRGALTMASVELSGGRYGPAKALARAVIRSRRAELVEMERLRASLT